MCLEICTLFWKGQTGIADPSYFLMQLHTRTHTHNANTHTHTHKMQTRTHIHTCAHTRTHIDTSTRAYTRSWLTILRAIQVQTSGLLWGKQVSLPLMKTSVLHRCGESVSAPDCLCMLTQCITQICTFKPCVYDTAIRLHTFLYACTPSLGWETGQPCLNLHPFCRCSRVCLLGELSATSFCLLFL